MSLQLDNSRGLLDSQQRMLFDDGTDEKAGEIEQVPLSFAQQRLWLVEQIHPGTPLYNVPCAVRLRGKLKVEAVRHSLEKIIERHEVLRTVYVLHEDAPRQKIMAECTIEVPLIDLSNLAKEEKEMQLSARLTEEARRPFDVSRDLMLRAVLFRLEEEDHVLFLNIHHIACDEWSLGVLFRELGKIYEACCEGKPVSLAEPAIQYADFALWQREWAQGKVMQVQLEYWLKQLSGELPKLELPADHPRPAIQTHDGARAVRVLSPRLVTSLRTLCRDEGVTLFMLLLSAFKVLLHRYTAQEDIIVGTPIAGRNRVETEDLIGFFVNTLALRTKISSELTFRELLQRVRDVSLGAFSNQDLPFEKLVEVIQPERNAAQNPVFNVMFTLQNPPEEMRMAGLAMTPVEVATATAKFDLTLVLQETREGLVAAFEYNTALFAPATPARMLGHLETLLEGIVSNPAQKISKLPLLTLSEQQQLLIEWNCTASDYPRTATVHQLFEAQVARTPNATAAIYGEQAISYRELGERSNQLANYLRKAGVGPNSLVGICVERSVDMLVGWLGILKAGAAYVPVDPRYPSERIAFMIEDTRMPLLLTQRRLASRLPDNVRKICLDADWKAISREKTSALENTTTAESVAYVIYTSGSTGKPKGVLVPHRGIVRLLFDTNYIQLDAFERMAQASNASFDAATFEVWGALLHGGTLIGIKQDVLLSPSELVAQLRQHRITTLFLTTALFNQMAAEVPDGFKTLKHVLFGGEACDPKSVSEILKDGPPSQLLHVYGPTETTTFASWFEVKEVPENATTLPIGRPISNTTFYVLDRNMEPVPVGVPGELFIGGDGVACGYHNRPELHATKFIRNPFVSTDVLLYRTGDLVRYLPDGNVEFLGRIDNQVKIRGFRIELEEIESVIEQHLEVRDAVVLARDQHGSGKQLVAYVVAKNGHPPSTDELRRFMKEKLPEFMVPSAFVFLPVLPLTPNGKVDRRALPAPSHAEVEAHELIPPRNNLENQLRKIWESVLGVKPIGVRANFFELGGHSLLAVRLFTQIEKQLGTKLPLSTLFQAPTIEQLASIISTKSWSAPGASLVEIQPSGCRPPIFWLHTLGGGGGGGLFRYRKLAELLGPDQPSYGLVTPPEPFTRIEDMAAHYINEMRTLQPKGPYFLGGYCFGGIIAFEMARQLEAAGTPVGLLALIESLPPNCEHKTKPTSALARQFFGNLPRWTADVVRQGPTELFARARRKATALLRKVGQHTRHASDGDSLADIQAQLNEVIDFSQYPADFKRYAQIHWKALGAYQPKVYPGKVTLFRTRKARLLELEPETIWARFAATVEVKWVPGTHEKILDEPYVEVLARQVSECLREASGKPLEIGMQ